VELGLWLAAPACASILADWGADVVKIEPLGGDPFRGLAWAFGGEMNPPFELDNRGKRSIAVDLRTEGGLDVLWALLSAADLFVTNYRPGGLERLGLDWPTVHARLPQLIYGSITGYGLGAPSATVPPTTWAPTGSPGCGGADAARRGPAVPARWLR
jgi:crotonobetainyl-CoA:carnitine CoA-transferase CaiB-like acyl-CoA transferase